MSGIKQKDRVLIEITETRAISADAHQWMVMKRTKKMDKETGLPSGGYSKWDFYKSYTTPMQCAAQIQHELIATCGARSFPELRKAVNHIHESILEIVKESNVLKLHF